MTGFSYHEGVLCADSNPLSDIAERWGTPCWVYSAAKIRERYAALDGALTRALGDHPRLIAYACKSNGNLAVLRIFKNLGAGADVVSGGEMRRALAAGIPAQSIVYSGVGKSAAEIALAIDSGIGQINVESAEELDLILTVAARGDKTARLAFRINPDVDAGTHAKITTGKAENKFGIPISALETLWRHAAAAPGVRPVGLSVHIGSQMTDTAPFAKAFEILAKTARPLDVETLDIGGGLGIVYQETDTPPDLDAYCGLIRDILAPLKAKIILEPGRFLVAEAGALLSRILYIKKTDSRNYAILDAGMNELLRPALYDAWHPILSVRQAPEGVPLRPYDIVGPVCETGDTFAKDRPLPPLQPGDPIAILAAGAYGAVMSSTYNVRPLAPEILVDGAQTATIRKRQSVEELLACETIPEWLS